MANTLDPMDLKQIITLHLDGYSNRSIGTSLGISRNTVNTYMRLFKGSDHTFKELLSFGNARLESLFSSHTTIDNGRYDELMHYFGGMNKARNHPGFTFLHHYDEYAQRAKEPYGYTHTFFDKKTDITIAVVQRSNFGLRYAFQKGMIGNSILEVPPEEKLIISTHVQKEYWGIFEKYTSIAQHKSTKFTKTALVGNSIKKGLPALYLTDRQRPMVIAGNAKITGDAYLPAQGIRMGSISGNSYRYDQLVYGNQRQSNSKIPQFDAEVAKNIRDLLENFQGKGETVSIKRNLEIKNSFQSPTKQITNRTVHLENIYLIGNIAIFASEKIVVEPSAILQDVLLIAPEIIIKDGVKGSFQAFADNSIFVGKQCELYYPTGLVVLEKNQETIKGKSNRPKLSIDSGTTLSGAMLYMHEFEEQTYFPQIKISKGALVRGEVYCTENLELKGSVIGNVTTNGFISLENGSIYQNHLFDGTIDSHKLPKEYVGLAIGNERPKEVIKWLY